MRYPVVLPCGSAVRVIDLKLANDPLNLCSIICHRETPASDDVTRGRVASASPRTMFTAQVLPRLKFVRVPAHLADCRSNNPRSMFDALPPQTTDARASYTVQALGRAMVCTPRAHGDERARFDACARPPA